MAAADQDRDQRELRFRDLYQANFRYLKAWAAGPSANGGLSLQIDLVQATPSAPASPGSSSTRVRTPELVRPSHPLAGISTGQSDAHSPRRSMP